MGGMESSPAARENGDLIVCPGTIVNITCTHINRDNQTAWEVEGFPRSVALHDLGQTTPTSVGPFNYSTIGGHSGPTLTSTIQTTVTESLNGTVVLCRAGGLPADTEVGRVTVRVVGTLLWCWPCGYVCVHTY